MSLKTWIKEFYTPLPELYDGGLGKWSWKEALEHSLRKWQGFTKSNLAKHRVTLVDDIYTVYPYLIYRGAKFVINEDSCALCRKAGVCGECVLAFGERMVFQQPCGYEYRIVSKDNGESMRRLLKKALKEHQND